MSTTVLTIHKNDWHQKNGRWIAVVPCRGVLPDRIGQEGRRDQRINVNPIDQQWEWGVSCIGSYKDALVFSCLIVPTRDVRVGVIIQNFRSLII